jgi:hypothetical protein
MDIVAVSKRLGHSNPAITLRVYSHLFDSRTDDAAAAVIEQALGTMRKHAEETAPEFGSKSGPTA